LQNLFRSFFIYFHKKIHKKSKRPGWDLPDSPTGNTVLAFHPALFERIRDAFARTCPASRLPADGPYLQFI